jgi:acetone carboxylase gamma subunit
VIKSKQKRLSTCECGYGKGFREERWEWLEGVLRFNSIVIKKH